MRRFLTLRWLNAAAYLAMVTVNALAVLLPINGVTPGEVSDSYPNLFAPAGFAFSIWGVIYLLLLAFILYQLGLFGSNGEAAARVGPLFILSSGFNVAWIFCWHYGLIPLSLLCMAGLLIALALAYTRVARAAQSPGQRLFVRLPFAVYFGWITVAAIANVTTALVYAGWDGFGLPEQLWTVAALVLGLLISLTVTLRKSAPAYGLAVAWGYFGILARHLSDGGFARAYPSVIWTAAAGIALLLAAVLAALFRQTDGCA